MTPRLPVGGFHTDIYGTWPIPKGKRTCSSCGLTKDNNLFRYYTAWVISQQVRKLRTLTFCSDCWLGRKKEIKRKYQLTIVRKKYDPFREARVGETKVTEDVVAFIRSRTGFAAANTTLAKMFNLGAEYIRQIKRGSSWKHIIGVKIEYHPAYAGPIHQLRDPKDRGGHNRLRKKLQSVHPLPEQDSDGATMQEVQDSAEAECKG